MLSEDLATMDSTVKTRVFIISDTHDGFQGSSADPYTKDDGAFRPPLPKADVLLHSGDLTMVGTMNEYRSAIAMLKDIDAELKFVIAGNHDLSLHGDFYRTFGSKLSKRLQRDRYDEDMAQQAIELWTGPEAKSAGITYLTEGLHEFELSNGARFTIYASQWQPEFFDWAFNYPHFEDRWNPPHLVNPEPLGATEPVVPAPPERDPHPIPEGATVDIIMTHGPPWMHLDKCDRGGHRAGCPQLLRALDRVRPRLHCFGHIHEAWGAERVTWKDVNGKPGDGHVGEKTETIGILGAPRNSGIQTPQDSEVIERRGAYVDVSRGSSRPLEAGKETLLVNSSIMTLTYKAGHAGWIVDLELPMKMT